MKSRLYRFKFFDPEEEGDIYFGQVQIKFDEDLNIVTERDKDDIIVKVSEIIKNQIKQNYKKRRRHIHNIILFHFEKQVWSPFSNDLCNKIVHHVTIDKEMLGIYSNLVAVLETALIYLKII